MHADTAAWIGETLVGRYRIETHLGSGGMAHVFRAHDAEAGADVVVKLPKPEFLKDPEAAKRFVREVRAMARLKHPNIVRVLDSGAADGVPFAIIEYLSGGSLADRKPVAPDGSPQPMPPETLAGWLLPIASALDYIHQQGYVHRDVKPDNLLFDDDGKVYLSDFGIAKLLGGGENAPQTVTTAAGMALGTPQYMAPEVLLARPYDGRADQYGLAITVYEMLCGHCPFEGANSLVIVQQTTEDPVPLTARVSGLSADLWAAIGRGLEKEPGRRCGSCMAFATAVLKMLPREAVSEQTSSRLPVRALSCPDCRSRVPLPDRPGPKPLKCPQCGTCFERCMTGLHGVAELRSGRRDWKTQRLSTETKTRQHTQALQKAASPKRGRSRRSMAIVIAALAVVLTAPIVWFNASRKRPDAPASPQVAMTTPAPSDSRIEPPPPSPGPPDPPRPAKPEAKKEPSNLPTDLSPKGGSKEIAAKLPTPPDNSVIAPPMIPPPVGRPGLMSVPAIHDQPESFDYEFEGKPLRGMRNVTSVDLGSGESMKLVRIHKGEFDMGSPLTEKERVNDVELRHRVIVHEDFYLGMFEVTRAQYDIVVRGGPQRFTRDPQKPVDSVSWRDARRFCKQLSEKTGLSFVLPTEEQWEYACRAGSSTPFNFGSMLSGDLANCNGNYPYPPENKSKGRPSESTTLGNKYKPNAWGLYDMHGNVAEWCAAKDGGDGENEKFRAVRGGSWKWIAAHCRSAYRSFSEPYVTESHIGFRVAMIPSSVAKEPVPILPKDKFGAGPVVIGRPPLGAGEKEPFGYVHNGEKKNDTRRVLTVEIKKNVNMKFVRIGKGEFTKGSPDAEKDATIYLDFEGRPFPRSKIVEVQKRVRINHDFYLGMYEVRQDQYEAVMGIVKNRFAFPGATRPVESVTWAEAKTFCSRLPQANGLQFCLPTSDEWEYACRAGTSTAFHFGPELNGDMANCDGRFPYPRGKPGERSSGTTPVGNYGPNPWGLFDMHGNVAEWCASEPSMSRVSVRGGSWKNSCTTCRAAVAFNHERDDRQSHIGFRVAIYIVDKEGKE